MSDYDDLLPCPFCGSAPILHEEAISGHQPVECTGTKCPMRFVWPDLKVWQAQAELSRMRTALEELIACKDLKDAIDNNDSDGIDRTFAELDDMVKDYERRKPLAWKAARAAIAERALAPEERALTAGSGL